MFKKNVSLNALFQVANNPIGQPAAGAPEPIHLSFNLIQSDANQTNEVGVFAVDDASGTVDGIAPGQAGYAIAALQRAQVIFSAVPRARFDLALQRRLTVEADSRLGFYLIANSTTDTILAGGGSPASVLFAHAVANAGGTEYAQVENFEASGFRLIWEDAVGGDRDFNDLVLDVQIAPQAPAPETALQGEVELIDLTSQVGPIAVSITVRSSAEYQNSFGFYIVDDASGRIGDLQPGDPGYARAAIQNRIDYNPGLPGGKLLAPFFIANGTVEDWLAQNISNTLTDSAPVAYFPFLAANPDGVDHIRLLGDNTFAFEDLAGGGDRDYNDLVIQLQIASLAPTNAPNTPPALVQALLDQIADSGNLFAFNVTNSFNDADGDALTYSATLAGGSALPIWLTFDPATGAFSGTPSDSDAGSLDVVVAADDGRGGTITDSFELTVTADPANNAPVNSVPGAQAVAAGGTLSFSGSNQIAIADSDAANNPLEVTLTAANGNLTLGSLTGLTVVSGSNGSDAVTVEGTLTDLNTALAGLTFEPSLGFTGAAQLLLTTNDLGHTGSGGPLSDTDAIDITVTASDTTPPLVASLAAADITTGGGTSYSFTVQYADDVAIAVSSLGGSDLTVTGPLGTLPVVLVSATPSSDSAAIAATYEVAAPGGSWDIADNGNYTINAANNEVLDTASNALTSGNLGNFTVNIDPMLPEYNFSTATYSTIEGNATNTSTVVTVLRSGNTSTASSVEIVLTDNTATAGSDFTAGPVTVNFAPGEISKTVPIAILGDAVPEANESVDLSFSGNAGTVNPTATLTLVNDDTAIAYDFSTTSYNVLEGDANNTIDVVTVIRSGNTGVASAVEVVLAGGATDPATPGTDFTAGPVALNFAAGETVKTVPIALLGEVIAEASETIALSFSGNAGTVNPTATLTLTNDDTPAVTYDFSTTSYNVLEGDASNTVNVVTVIRSGDTGVASAVDVVLAGGATNPATPGTDFTAGPIALNFAVGEAVKTVPIEILGEIDNEADEAIALSFTNFSPGGSAGATHPTATLTVTNDDSPPIYDFSGASFTTLEGDASSIFAGIQVLRSGNTTIASSVEVISTGSGSNPATAGSDFTAGPIALTFAPGETVKIVNLELLGDTANEPDEALTLSLANFSGGGQAGTTNPTATLTLANDDGALPIYNFSTATYSTLEGNATDTSPVVTVLRSGNISVASSVDVVLTGNTATAGADFTAGPVAVSFAAGETVKTVPIELLGDTAPEADETIDLSFSSNAGTSHPTATLTLTNDDVAAVTYDFSTAGYSALEGGASNTTNVVTVIRSGNTGIAASVDVVLTGNTATAGADFTAGPIALNFAAGETVKTVPIELLGDNVPEANETLDLSFSGDAGTSHPTATLTLTNDDFPPIYDFTTATYSTIEGNATNTSTTVTVLRSGNTSIASSVEIVLAGNTATAGTDFTAGPVTLNFAPSEILKTVPIELLGDAIPEADETLDLSFSSNAGTGNPTATLTLANDDTAIAYDFSAASYNILEGDTNNTFNVVTVIRSGNTSVASAVDIALAGGATDPATPGTDFTAGPVTLNFAVGETSQTVPIEILGEISHEADEAIALSFTNFSPGGLAGTTNATATLTLTNDDVPPIYDFSSATFTTVEGDVTNTFTGIEVLRAGDTTGTSTVDVILTGSGTNPAIAGSDFTAGPITLTFAPGETAQIVNLELLGEVIYELDEALTLSLANFSTGGAGTTNPTATLTLVNDDVPTVYDFSGGSFTAIEGDVNNTFTGIEVLRSGETSIASSVAVILTGSGSSPAAPGSDFMAGPIVLNFAPGETAQIVNLELIGDEITEPDETLTLSLANFSPGGQVGITDPAALLTLIDDDVTLLIDDVTVAQDETATKTATFTVSLSSPSSLPVTVDFASLDVTAIAPDDYTAVSGTLTFAPGVTTQTIDVTIEPAPTLPMLSGIIEGTVWDDLNGNGTRDGGEPGLSGQTVFVDLDLDGVLDTGEASVLTDSSGQYSFTGFVPGNYAITVQAGSLTQTFPELTPGQPSVLIPVSDRRDHVFDPVRNRLYIATGSGMIERYDLTTNTLLTPWNLPTATLNGLDITPSGDALYVADGINSALHKINPNSGTVTTLNYIPEPGEAEAWDVAIDRNGIGFVTAEFGGSGVVPIRELDTATDTFTIRSDPPGSSLTDGKVRPRTHIRRNATRTDFLFAEPLSIQGPIFTYDALAESTETFEVNLSNSVGSTLTDPVGIGTIEDTPFSNSVNSGAFLFNAIAAVNHDGSLIAVEDFSNIEIYDSDLTSGLSSVHTLSGFTGGLVFDSLRDILYAADASSEEIVAYETNSWNELYRFNIGENIGSSGDFGFGSGVMSMSDDGRYLFMSTDLGLRMFELPQLGSQLVSLGSGQTVSGIDFGLT